MKMKSKKFFIIGAIIIIIVVGAVVGYHIIQVNLGNFLFSQSGEIVDGHKDLMEHLKNIEDKEERKKQIDFSLQQNIITQEEANELY